MKPKIRFYGYALIKVMGRKHAVDEYTEYVFLSDRFNVLINDSIKSNVIIQYPYLVLKMISTQKS